MDVYGEGWETLKRVLGEKRRAPFRIGDTVPAGICGWGETVVVDIYEDPLENEIWITEFNFKHIEMKRRCLLSPATLKMMLPSLFLSPDIVIYDKDKEGAIHYGRIKSIGSNLLYVFAVVGYQSLRFLTVIDKRQLYDKIRSRYWILWRKDESS